MLVLAVLFLFPALMSFAASSDLITMTISNTISLALLAGFFVIAAWAGMSVETMLWHLACGMTVLVITFTLFAFGWIGGGDAKLAAATAVWFGFAQIIEYGTLASVLGGLLTLGIMWMRGMEAPPQLAAADWFARLHNKSNGVPYGIALAASGLLLYPETAIFAAASGA
jgi:prepilin peptidase CpaA